jgi:hypothetical protein
MLAAALPAAALPAVRTAVTTSQAAAETVSRLSPFTSNGSRPIIEAPDEKSRAVKQPWLVPGVSVAWIPQFPVRLPASP